MPKIARSCAPCYKLKARCDGKRPCMRCVRLKREDACMSRRVRVRKPAQTKRSKAEAQEELDAMLENKRQLISSICPRPHPPLNRGAVGYLGDFKLHTPGVQSDAVFSDPCAFLQTMSGMLRGSLAHALHKFDHGRQGLTAGWVAHMLLVHRIKMRWSDFCEVAGRWRGVKAMRVFFSDLTQALGLPSFVPSLTFPRAWMDCFDSRSCAPPSDVKIDSPGDRDCSSPVLSHFGANAVATFVYERRFRIIQQVPAVAATAFVKLCDAVERNDLAFHEALAQCVREEVFGKQLAHALQVQSQLQLACLLLQQRMTTEAAVHLNAVQAAAGSQSSSPSSWSDSGSAPPSPLALDDAASPSGKLNHLVKHAPQLSPAQASAETKSKPSQLAVSAGASSGAELRSSGSRADADDENSGSGSGSSTEAEDSGDDATDNCPASATQRTNFDSSRAQGLTSSAAAPASSTALTSSGCSSAFTALSPALQSMLQTIVGMSTIFHALESGIPLDDDAACHAQQFHRCPSDCHVTANEEFHQHFGWSAEELGSMHQWGGIQAYRMYAPDDWGRISKAVLDAHCNPSSQIRMAVSVRTKANSYQPCLLAINMELDTRGERPYRQVTSLMPISDALAQPLD